MYAIVEDSGTQIRVSEGDVIKVDRRDLPADAGTLTFDRVLLVGAAEGEKGKLKIGEPLVKGASVTAEILEEGREKKLEVIKFKRRKGYKRRNGHRQPFLRVKVTKIKG